MGSVWYDVAMLPKEQRKDAILKACEEYPASFLAYDWRGASARPDQIIDYTDGNVLLETARGWGKTRTLCEHLREEVTAGRAKSIGIVVPKYPHLRNVIYGCFREIFPPSQIPEIKDGGRKFLFHTGAEALGFSSEAMTNVRGNEFDLLIGDEVAYWEHPMDTFLDALPALRKPGARWVFATTPPIDIEQASAIEFMEYLRENCTRHITGTMRENVFLPEQAIEDMLATMVEGSIRWRVEVLGEPVSQPEGALWRTSDISIVQDLPKLRRIVIAVDVAGSIRESADETGICVVGLGEDRVAYVLEDCSGKYLPDEWARVVKEKFRSWGANYIVIEKNYGGEMVKTILHSADSTLPTRSLTTDDSKFARAEPVAVLYRRGLVKHLRGLAKLETQMLRWSPMITGNAVADRLDAMVYGVTELLIRRSGTQVNDLSVRA